MGAYIPHDVPQFLCDERFMSVLDDNLIFLGDVHPGLVLVGDRCAFLRVVMTEIFYTYGSTLELNGQQFDAGRLTEDLLNFFSSC